MTGTTLARQIAKLRIAFLVLPFLSPLAPAVAEGDTPRTAVKVLSDEQVGDGWVALLDGESLYGWHQPPEVGWKIRQGTLRSEEADRPIYFATRFSRFRLKFQYQPNPTGQAMLLLSEQYDTPPSPTPLTLPIPQEASPPSSAPAWGDVEVVAERDEITLSIGGQVVAKVDRPTPAPVHIGFSSHKGPIAVRNVVLKPLALRELFNGSDLTGWSLKHAAKSRCDVTPEGEMRVRGGFGQIETTETFDDFVLQLEAKTLTERVNSGLFFRAISGTFRKIQGYESQIYNAVDPDKPEQPRQFGTGGLYLRQPARRQVAEDGKWFAKTIVADGPHFAIWVNGMLVCDHTDERPLASNARQGTRLTAGVICLQGHDPGTDILFRKMTIGSYR